HLRIGVSVRAANVRSLGTSAQDGEVGPVSLGDHLADADHVRGELDSESAEQLLADRANRDAGGGVARACPLEHVARVVGFVFERARQIRMSWSWTRDLLAARRRRPRIHGFAPVVEIAVANAERDGRPGGPAAAQARQHLDLIFLNLHATTAAVTHLAARE